jgi:hypothetical protein
LKTFWKHRDTESTERKTRGGKTRGRKTRGGIEKQGEGRVKKGDMLAMLDAGLYF